MIFNLNNKRNKFQNIKANYLRNGKYSDIFCSDTQDLDQRLMFIMSNYPRKLAKFTVEAFSKRRFKLYS